MKLTDLAINSFVNSDFEENIYLLHRKDSSEAVVIDPGMGPQGAISFLKEKNLTPSAILITHGHYDHIAGVDAFRAVWPDVKIYIGELDRSKMKDPAGNLSKNFGFPVTTAADADFSLADGEEFSVAGISFQTLLIPGHTCGHVAFKVTAEDGVIVFVGDIIFAGSVGRTDFPGGSMESLLAGIQKKLMTLPDSAIFYPGHGPSTTCGQEKKFNPWIP